MDIREQIYWLQIAERQLAKLNEGYFSLRIRGWRTPAAILRIDTLTVVMWVTVRGRRSAAGNILVFDFTKPIVADRLIGYERGTGSLLAIFPTHELLQNIRAGRNQAMAIQECLQGGVMVVKSLPRPKDYLTLVRNTAIIRDEIPIINFGTAVELTQLVR